MDPRLAALRRLASPPELARAAQIAPDRLAVAAIVSEAAAIALAETGAAPPATAWPLRWSEQLAEAAERLASAAPEAGLRAGAALCLLLHQACELDEGRPGDERVPRFVAALRSALTSGDVDARKDLQRQAKAWREEAEAVEEAPPGVEELALAFEAARRPGRLARLARMALDTLEDLDWCRAEAPSLVCGVLAAEALRWALEGCDGA